MIWALGWCRGGWFEGTKFGKSWTSPKIPTDCFQNIIQSFLQLDIQTTTRLNRLRSFRNTSVLPSVWSSLREGLPGYEILGRAHFLGALDAASTHLRSKSTIRSSSRISLGKFVYGTNCTYDGRREFCDLSRRASHCWIPLCASSWNLIIFVGRFLWDTFKTERVQNAGQSQRIWEKSERLHVCGFQLQGFWRFTHVRCKMESLMWIVRSNSCDLHKFTWVM